MKELLHYYSVSQTVLILSLFYRCLQYPYCLYFTISNIYSRIQQGSSMELLKFVSRIISPSRVCWQNGEKRILASSCLSVRPTSHRGTTRNPLHGCLWNVMFEDISKICLENSSFIKLDKKIGYCTWTPIYTFSIIRRSFLLGVSNVSDKLKEKIKTHILRSVIFGFFFENRAVYEIMWKNIVECGMPQWQHGTSSLHSGHLRLQTQTQSM